MLLCDAKNTLVLVVILNITYVCQYVLDMEHHGKNQLRPSKLRYRRQFKVIPQEKSSR